MYYISFNETTRKIIGITAQERKGPDDKIIPMIASNVIKLSDSSMLRVMSQITSKYVLKVNYLSFITKNEFNENVLADGYTDIDLFDISPSWPPIGYTEDPNIEGKLLPLSYADQVVNNIIDPLTEMEKVKNNINYYRDFIMMSAYENEIIRIKRDTYRSIVIDSSSVVWDTGYVFERNASEMISYYDRNTAFPDSSLMSLSPTVLWKDNSNTSHVLTYAELKSLRDLIKADVDTAITASMNDLKVETGLALYSSAWTAKNDIDALYQAYLTQTATIDDIINFNYKQYFPLTVKGITVKI